MLGREIAEQSDPRVCRKSFARSGEASYPGLFTIVRRPAMTDDRPLLPGTVFRSEDAPNHGREFLARYGGTTGGVQPTPEDIAAWAESDDRELHPERGLYGDAARAAGRHLFAEKAKPTRDVWTDIEDDPGVAANLRLRSEYMCAIGEQITRQGWSHATAAATLGLTQPRVADLLTGKINRFTLDDLIAIGFKVGVRVAVQ